MKIFKKAVSILLIIGSALTGLSACQAERLTGEELVLKARKDFSQLKSGVITVTNAEGMVEQTFSFKYDEVGILSYSCVGETNGEKYFQYSNGYETYTIENGSYSFVKKGEKDFDCYTYDVRHPQTDEDYFYFDSGKVSAVTWFEENGEKSYCYIYDEKLIASENENGKLTDFSVTYVFDDNDELKYVEEFPSFEKDGTETDYCYRITVTERDSLGKVNMPEEIEKAKQEGRFD